MGFLLGDAAFVFVGVTFKTGGMVALAGLWERICEAGLAVAGVFSPWGFKELATPGDFCGV